MPKRPRPQVPARGGTPAPPPTLLPHLTYISELLWLISAQLHALTGGCEDYPIPDAESVAGGCIARRDNRRPDRAALLTRLKGGPRHD